MHRLSVYSEMVSLMLMVKIGNINVKLQAIFSMSKTFEIILQSMFDYLQNKKKLETNA